MTLILLALACVPDLAPLVANDPDNGVPAVEPAAPPEPQYDEAEISAVLAQLTADDAAAKAEAFKAFPTVEVDEVAGRKTRRAKAAPKFVNSRTTVHAKLVTDMADVVKLVALRWVYVSDSWLFFDHATVAVGDFRARVTFDDPRRDNGSGEIWEHATLIMGSIIPIDGMSIGRDVAEKMADPGKVTIRLEGRQHYDDYELKAWEKASIKAALVLTKPVPTRDEAAAVLAARPPEAAPGTLNTTEAQ